MKFYQSPLSIFGSLYILASFYLLYLVFSSGLFSDKMYLWVFLTGAVMLGIDYFLRRSRIPVLLKLLIQFLIGIAPIALLYLFLIGVIRLG